MTRTRVFLFNTLTAAALHIVTIIAGFIVPRIMLTVYGSEINGLVTSVTQFIAYFVSLKPVSAGAAVYALYQPLADKDYTRINSILSASRYFYKQAGYIFVSLVLGLALIYPVLIKSTAATFIEIGVLYCSGCKGIA